MNWVDETRRHEGYVVAVLADGGEPGPAAGGRKPWWSYNGADGPRAVAVRGACACGWRGAETHPVDFGDDELTEGHDAPTGPYADWDHHVTAAEGPVPQDVEQMLTALRRRVEELSDQQPLTALRIIGRIEKETPQYTLDVVRNAQRGLVGWEAVGKALGITPTAAEERFSPHLDH